MARKQRFVFSHNQGSESYFFDRKSGGKLNTMLSYAGTKTKRGTWTLFRRNKITRRK